MSRSSFDYDFDWAAKPCGGQVPNPTGECVGKENCLWFLMCDLPQKNPPEKPLRPKTGRKLC